VLRASLLLYLAASLLHFTHNAEHVRAYPNLPAWISRDSVYLVWLGITAVGTAGYLLYLRRGSTAGLVLMILYALAGPEGLLHYTRAPISAHTAAMNVTILFEAVMGLVLFVVLVLAAIAHLRRPERDA
jgi:hypothetical protein